MKRAKISRGRIEEHSKGLGTVTEELVEQRARELAVAHGRRADQLNRSDLEEARQELESSESPRAAELPESGVPAAPDGSPPVTSGRSAPTRGATDEQNLPADLAAEGVEEADHEQRVAGNTQSRKRDEKYDDQLSG